MAVRNAGHRGDKSGAGRPIHQCDAVKEESGSERAQEEIFERGLTGLQRIAPVSGKNVARDGAHLEADKGGEQLLGGGQNPHAGGSEKNERVKFGAFQFLAGKIGTADQNNQNADQADEQVEEKAKGIRADEIEEAGAAVLVSQDGGGHAGAGPDERNDG